MRALVTWAAVGAVAVLGLALAGTAAAQTSFCPKGSGAGQCDEPEGVAVSQETGNVYVADLRNDRINVFDKDGNPLFAFGSGQLDEPRALAIDRDPLNISSSDGDVYVFDSGNQRVVRFAADGSFKNVIGGPGSGAGQFARLDDQIGVGPGGTIHVSDCVNGNGGKQLRSTRGEVRALRAFHRILEIGGRGRPAGIAIDSAGDAYVTRPSGRVEKYELSEPDATKLKDAGVGSNSKVLTIDPASNHIFVQQLESKVGGGFHIVIVEYDTVLNELSRFGYGEIKENLGGLSGIAVAKDGKGIYGSEEFSGGGNRVALFPLPGPGPLVCCVEVVSVGNTKATLGAGINPEGDATTYHFEYVDDAAFEANGGFATAKSTPPATISTDLLLLHQVNTVIGCPDPEVEAELPGSPCLDPETTYHFRVVAENAKSPVGEPAIVEGEPFTTKPPLEILATFATKVGTDSARLNATVDPLGIPATGYFEYVEDTAYQEDKGKGGDGFATATRSPSEAQAPLNFESEGATTRFVQLSSLTPDTLYHYRVFANDPLIDAPIAGEPRTFTTFPLLGSVSPCPNASFRIGAAAALPNCRAYEMVSPVDKNGADIEVLLNARQYLARLDQSATGGERFTYSAATAFGDASGAPFTSQYLARRIDDVQWETEPISPPRESKIITGNTAATLDMQFKAFSAELESGWLFHDTGPVLDECGEAGFLNLYRRNNDTGAYEALTTSPPTNQNSNEYWPQLQGLSADGSRAIFSANGKLAVTGTAASNAKTSSGQPIAQLYEHVQGEGCGQLRLVSVLPNGNASGKSSALGIRQELGTGEDRENMVARAVSADGARVFWSVPKEEGGAGEGALYARIEGKKTLEISPGPALLWTATTNGSEAFYTLGQELYAYDVDKALAAEAPLQTLIAKGVLGVVEASEDGSRLYFVSNEALEGEGKVGAANLFLREGGETKLVATLDTADVDRGSFAKSGFSVAPSEANKRGTRMTPDGAHLAFVSTASLTGYDNIDASDGHPALELFLYDAATEELHCISCNPSGARPEAREFKGNLAASLMVAAQMTPSETQFYLPRNLSTDGNRLFFESFEALLPRDTNGKGDVYEWERAASQSQCDSMGAELFVASAGGCLSLISSGESPSDSTFVDADIDGSDAFIRTAASLLPQDPGLVDIYDARVNGGLPTPPTPKKPCEGEACQIPSPPPQALTPASAALEGAGNLPPAKGCPRGKRKVRRKGRTRCVPRQASRRQGAKARPQRRPSR